MALTPEQISQILSYTQPKQSLLKMGLEQPKPTELGFLIDWLNKIGVRQQGGLGFQEEYNPMQFYNPNLNYDLLNAFRANLMRGFDSSTGEQHFTDQFKFPWHPSFSTQSQYYQQGMPAIQPLLENGKWNYLPAGINPVTNKFRFQY